MNIRHTALALVSALALMAGTAEARVNLKLANALSDDHPTSIALQKFADEVEEKTGGEVKIRLFLNGVLGSEREVLEQLQNGAVDITRVSAANLENFNPIYRAFNLPYIFNDEDHFYQVMTGPIAEEVYQATASSGFTGLTFFDSGARSFYTKSKAINTPDDLVGQKIRVINSNVSIRMVELMGGTPTPLPYGEIYTALQQGVIDGAENNPTALTIGRHGEVARFYSQDEHQRIPDFLVISNAASDKLSDEQKAVVKEAAVNATLAFRDLWNTAMADAVTEAEAEGVTFSKPDIAPFRAKVAPLVEEFRADPQVGPLLNRIIESQ
ncbi:TRAP transporter substrate-binding protein [Paracoccus sp. (in: a-proteobacteria)]|uniref:TRAP transporter substrate-binding protein n=1 Tax=Paracoccus sp. TaxID=267 RepID=UPI003A84D919